MGGLADKDVCTATISMQDTDAMAVLQSAYNGCKKLEIALHLFDARLAREQLPGGARRNRLKEQCILRGAHQPNDVGLRRLRNKLE
eukprot:m.91009 g.91009  ORF g.91009 m.91009 type:complete len:86 (-) comp8484_c0_seq1:1230-1487(-)